jgi:hypothetical protein
MTTTKIKTEKISTTTKHLKIWIPKNITIDDVRKVLKEKHLLAYHMWTRDPIYVSIGYRDKSELERAKSFVKIISEISDKRVMEI